jgi:hypothetical protein
MAAFVQLVEVDLLNTSSHSPSDMVLPTPQEAKIQKKEANRLVKTG